MQNKQQNIVECFKSNNREMAILLLKGWNNFGDRVYSYSQVPYTKIKEIQEQIASNMPVNIRNYGRVLAAGLDEPTAELHHEIAMEYSMAPVAAMNEYIAS